MAKSTKKTSVARRNGVKKVANARMKIEDNNKLKVVGDHNCREGSRYYKAFELMRKTGTVGDFYKKFKPSGSESPREVVRAAINNGYVKLA